MSNYPGWRRIMALVLGGALAIACSEGPTTPEDSPLAGLTREIVRDSTGSPVPGSGSGGSTSAYGGFRGIVVGEVIPAGSDTVSALAPVAGARVTAYPRNASGSDSLSVGPAAASVVTDANGVFRLSTLAAGGYIVTIVPPRESGYRGVWVGATAHTISTNYQWRIVLKKM